MNNKLISCAVSRKFKTQTGQTQNTVLEMVSLRLNIYASVTDTF